MQLLLLQGSKGAQNKTKKQPNKPDIASKNMKLKNPNESK
jgi:hypothetical protein